MTKQFRCAVCAKVFDGDAPPAVCPICGAGADAFVEVKRAQPTLVRDTVRQFVIVGGGAAGLACAQAIRARDSLSTIHLVCRENVIPYDRPALSDLLSGDSTFEELLSEPYDYYASSRITLHTGVRAESADLAAQTVLLSDGTALPYDALCLATGSNPFNPYGAGPDALVPRTLRTLEDVVSLSQDYPGKAIAVVGGGILGLEAAVALNNLGCGVKVLERGAHILSIQADAQVAELLERDLSKLGITILCNASVDRPGEGGLVMADGSLLSADGMLVSIGVRSETALARAAGLQVDRGIVVDERMRTSAPHVFAAGDCAQYGGTTGGNWPTASGQGDVAGAQMAGEDLSYRAMTMATAFEAGPIRLFSAGNIHGAEREQVQLAPSGALRKLFFAAGQLVGVLFYGDVSKSAEAIALIERGAAPDEAVRMLVS